MWDVEAMSMKHYEQFFYPYFDCKDISRIKFGLGQFHNICTPQI